MQPETLPTPPERIGLAGGVETLPEPIATALKALQKAAYRHGWVSGGDGDAPDSAAEFRHAVKVIAAAIAHPAGGDAAGVEVDISALVRMYGASERCFADARAKRSIVGTYEEDERYKDQLQARLLSHIATITAQLAAERRRAEVAEGEAARMRKALERIERWHGEFPPTGKFWDNGKEPMSYTAAYGSNGARDFMRGIAREALAPAPSSGEREAS